MARTANNAPLTDQGRADLQRVPTPAQNAFNENGDSQISALRALLVRLVSSTEYEPAQFPTLTFSVVDPSEFRFTRLSLFLWMTDRVLVSYAEQFYDDVVYPLGENTIPIGQDMTTMSAFCTPTNGMASLPTGVTCSPLAVPSGYGKQAVLAFGTGATALNVRGTPMLLELTDNQYFDDTEPPGQIALEPTIRVTAFSESILSGKHDWVFCPILPSGEIDVWVSSGGIEQVIMDLDDYIAGQYWLTNNLLFGALPIVGVYTQPPLP
jgi:hypothetical protein